MNSLWELAPWYFIMVLLICISGFFSASEAAMFYLRPVDRRRMKSEGGASLRALDLLEHPDRLLSAVLFWNLVVNMSYFAVSSYCVLQMDASLPGEASMAVAFALVTLLAIIFFSEMLPKCISVNQPVLVAKLVSGPLAIAVRSVDWLMPALVGTTLISRRLLWPGFRREPYLELADLERAIELSMQDQTLEEEERTILQNIVQLSEIRVDEWMRPRAQFQLFPATVERADLAGDFPASGYLLVSESGSDEVERSLRLDRVRTLPDGPLADLAQPVGYLPWCATVADAYEQMQREECEVIAIVNEFGETIGVLSIEDVIETVFSSEPSRSKRLLNLNPIHRIDAKTWVVSGMMSLKMLRRYFKKIELPETRSVTIAGIVQEQTQKLAHAGDLCHWGPFQFRILEAPQPTMVLLEMKYLPDTGPRHAS